VRLEKVGAGDKAEQGQGQGQGQDGQGQKSACHSNGRRGWTEKRIVRARRGEKDLIRGSARISTGTKLTPTIGLTTETRQRESIDTGRTVGHDGEIARHRTDRVGRLASHAHIVRPRDIHRDIVGFQLRSTVAHPSASDGHFEDAVLRIGEDLHDPVGSVAVDDTDAHPGGDRLRPVIRVRRHGRRHDSVADTLVQVESQGIVVDAQEGPLIESLRTIDLRALGVERFAGAPGGDLIRNGCAGAHARKRRCAIVDALDSAINGRENVKQVRWARTEESVFDICWIKREDVKSVGSDGHARFQSKRTCGGDWRREVRQCKAVVSIVSSFARFRESNNNNDHNHNRDNTREQTPYTSHFP